jgi:filamentous hemagglutinin family protein
MLNWMRGLKWTKVWVSSVAITLGMVLADTARAQIIPDNTLGTESSQVVQPFDGFDNIDVIDQGAIRGSNLFHSFQEFNVDEGRAAYFLSPSDDIQNILARVTGNNRSEILGPLGIINLELEISNQNLFLINPNGIIFGENSSLNIGGSFVGTTANSIEFGNQGVFSATNAETIPLLTVNPSAFLFSQLPHGDIISNSISPAGVDPAINPTATAQISGLRVPNGQSLILLGGDVTINGNSDLAAGLIALGGRVAVGGVRETGRISLDLDPDSSGFNFPDNLARANVSLTNRAIIDVNGEGSGSVQIQAANLVLSERSIIFATTIGEKNGSNIFIETTDAVTVDNSAILTGVGGILLDPQQATGRGGNIIIRTRQLTVTSNTSNGSLPGDFFGEIGTNSFGEGRAGSIIVEAERVSLRDGGQLTADAQSTGDAGDITINAAKSLEAIGYLEIEPNIFFSGPFFSGIFSETFSQDSGAGNAGNLTVITDELIVQDGATISARSRGMGQAGNLDVTANTASLDLGRITAETGSSQGGNIGLQISNSLQLRNSSEISASTQTGRGGSVSVQGLETLQVSDSKISASAETGRAGSLTINATESIELNGSEGLAVEATVLNGRAGDLTIETNRLSINEGASATVSSPQGQAGNLIINANNVYLNDGNLTAETGISGDGEGAVINLQGIDRLLLLQNGSQISARAFDQADGGNVLIDAENGFVIAALGERGNNDIIASADQGRGGRVDITTQGIFGIEQRDILSPFTNDINVSSQFGLNGEITINQLNTDPSRGLTELPTDLIDANTQMAQGCPANIQEAERIGEFINSGRGGIPPSPNDLLSNDNLATEWISASDIPQAVNPAGNAEISSSAPAPIIEAQGWTTDAQGKIMLIAQAPTLLQNRALFSPVQCP